MLIRKNFHNSAPIPLLLIAVLIIFYSITNVIWLSRDTLPPSWDQSGHLDTCLKYFRIFNPHRTSSLHAVKEILDASHFYPPFFYLSSLLATMVLGLSHHTIALTQLLYVAILAFSVYGIGKYLIHPYAGVGAAFLTLLYPMVYGLSREVLLDFPLLAMVALAQYMILVLRGGLVVRSSWALGLVMGLSMLTKSAAIIFLIGTWVSVIVFNLFSEKQLRRHAVIALGIALVVFLVLIVPWHLSVLPDFLKILKTSNLRDAIREGDPRPFTPEALYYYFQAVKEFLISDTLFLFAMLGSIAFVLWSKRWFVLSFLLSWIFLPYLALVGMPNKDGRYIVPILPAIALLTSAGMCAVPWKILRRALWCVLIVAGIIQFYRFSFNSPAPCYWARPPLRQDWKEEKILADLQKKFSAQPILIGVVAEQRYFNANTFGFYIHLQRLPFQVITLGDSSPITSEQIRQCDVIISKTGSLSPEYLSLYRNPFQYVFEKEGPASFGLTLWKKCNLPDQSEAEVYLKSK